MLTNACTPKSATIPQPNPLILQVTGTFRRVKPKKRPFRDRHQNGLRLATGNFYATEYKYTQFLGACHQICISDYIFITKFLQVPVTKKRAALLEAQHNAALRGFSLYFRFFVSLYFILQTYYKCLSPCHPPKKSVKPPRLLNNRSYAMFGKIPNNTVATAQIAITAPRIGGVFTFVSSSAGLKNIWDITLK